MAPTSSDPARHPSPAANVKATGDSLTEKFKIHGFKSLDLGKSSLGKLKAPAASSSSTISTATGNQTASVSAGGGVRNDVAAESGRAHDQALKRKRGRNGTASHVSAANETSDTENEGEKKPKRFNRRACRADKATASKRVKKATTKGSDAVVPPAYFNRNRTIKGSAGYNNNRIGDEAKTVAAPLDAISTVKNAISEDADKLEATTAAGSGDTVGDGEEIESAASPADTGFSDNNAISKDAAQVEATTAAGSGDAVGDVEETESAAAPADTPAAVIAFQDRQLTAQYQLNADLGTRITKVTTESKQMELAHKAALKAKAKEHAAEIKGLKAEVKKSKTQIANITMKDTLGYVDDMQADLKENQRDLKKAQKKIADLEWELEMTVEAL
ncbi:hypothetical protein LTR85_000103 [Meristemomyces frigidus]|nr:hypothetical protein LTR85_000103 [Meristemomyces frigidus]